MKRFIFILCFLPVVCFSASRHQWVVYKYVHSGDRSLIGCKIACVICGAGSSDPVPNISGGYCTCHTPPQSVLVASQHLCFTYPDNPSVDEPNFSNGVNPRLADMSPDELAAIDWDSTADNISPDVQMLTFYPNGSVVSLPDGGRGVATDNADGDRVIVPLVNGQATGYQDGVAGSYTIGGGGDLGYFTTFEPLWTGGVSDSSSSSPVNNGGSSVSVVPVGSSAAGSTSAGSTVFDVPQTEDRVNQEGDTYKVVSVPSTTVDLPNGSTITTYDYSSILNAIGSNVSSGFDKLHDDNNTINENLRKQLEIDTPPDVAQDREPDVDTSSVNTEVDQVMGDIQREGSGWDFSFGMGSNPVGDVITSMIGNPPTSFGSQDQVCNIDFELPLIGTLQYSFRLSDWFPSAFRSCVLFILSVIFAIASAKAVAGAFR